jgi:O-antigen/teichoic acid export membrane protein
MESAYLRYASQRSESKRYYATAQLLIAGVGTLLFFTLLSVYPIVQPLLGIHQQSLTDLYVLILGIILLDALAAVPFAELRLARRTYAYSIAKIINVGLNVFFNYVFVVHWQLGLASVFYANIIASGVTFIHVVFFTRSLVDIIFDRSLAQTLLRFGLPYIPAGIGYILNEGLSRFLLNRFDDTLFQELYHHPYTAADVTGIYGACYKLSVFMMLLSQMFRMAWQPFFMRYANDKEAPLLFARVFDYLNALAAFLFLLISVFLNEIAATPIPGLQGTVIDTRYWLGLNTVPFLLLAYWFQTWYTHFTAGIIIREKTMVLPKITLIGAGVTIISNIILISVWGMLGAASASAISYGVMSLALYYYSNKTFQIPYRLVAAFILMLSCLGLVYLSLSFFAKSIEYQVLTLFCGAFIILIITFLPVWTGRKVSV